MVTLAYSLAVMLFGASMIQYLVALVFERHFLASCRSSHPDQQPTTEPPEVAILMSVRGADPTLTDGIHSLLDQDHPNFGLHVVVDHRQDPAWAILQSCQQQHPHGSKLKLQVMENPRSTCSLKCHSLIQASERLPDSVQQIALIDADVLPHRSWLRELTRPLQAPDVGGVTGAQWFEPGDAAAWGSWLRCTWNSGAIVPTVFYRNPWAGSFSCRRRDLVESGLADRWSRAIVDDGPIRASMETLGKRIVVAPSLIMINRESCNFRFALKWTTRMLTWSRLHERTFWLTALHAVFSSSIILGTMAMLLLGSLGWICGVGPIVEQSVAVVGVSLAALATSGALCVAAYESARRCVAQSARLRGDVLKPVSWRQRLRILFSSGPAYLMFGLALVNSLVCRTISWRGIRYRIRGNQQIERLNYLPYTAIDRNPPGHSL